MLKALIFDVDGTLADTERDVHRVAFNEAFVASGLPVFWDVELYGQLLAVTGGKERLSYFFTHIRPDLRPTGDLQSLVAHLHMRKTEALTHLLQTKGVPLRPGVRRLLLEARAAGLKLAIATTTTPKNLVPILGALAPEAHSWFTVIGAGDCVPAKKPAADIYEYVLARLGLDAKECIAFEDSENGIRAARGAGIRTVVTVTDYTREQRFDGALIIVDHLGDPGMPLTYLGGIRQNGPLRDVPYLNVDFLRELLDHN